MNKEILDGYTQEEIEQLAIEALTKKEYVEQSELTYKITSIDKEYKKHNKSAIVKAAMNASIIIVFTSIVLNSDANFNSFNTENMVNVLNEINSKIPRAFGYNFIDYIYFRLFDEISKIIDKLGLIGVILASKTINFIFNSTKDSIKSVKMKKELNQLKEQLNSVKTNNKTI